MEINTYPGKIDLVMWTKNGEKTLPHALRRIEQVIPQDSINQKIMVDDKSSDDTAKIGESFGWHLISNEGTGISNGANTALKHVTMEAMASFEQDIILAVDWWSKITRLLAHPKVAVASGLRFLNKPLAVAKLDQYEAEKYCISELRYAEPIEEGGLIGKTLDNTIYKTRILKSLGGFPKIRTNSGVDTLLAHILWKHGYHWAVDCSVRSIHIRIGGLSEELRHSYRCARELNEIYRALMGITNSAITVDKKQILYRFLVSPISGFRMAVKTREPTIIVVYPLMRLAYVKGFLENPRLATLRN